MKCQLYTYNIVPKQYYSQPSFKAQPRLNWNTESGKLLVKGLTIAAVAAVAQFFPIDLRRKLEGFKAANVYRDSGEWVPEFLQQCPCDIQDAVKVETESLKDIYKNTTDPNIIDEYVQFYFNAFKNDDMSKLAHSNGNLYMELMYSPSVVLSLDVLGRKNLEAALKLGRVDFAKFCDSIYMMKQILTKDNLELLKSKINPENTKQYRSLQKDISKDKKEINRLLGKDARKKRKELEKEIDALKSDKSNYKQIKALKSQIQDLYKESENSYKIKELMQNINEKKLKLKELQNQKVNLTPKEIVKRLMVIDSFVLQLDRYTATKFNMDGFDEDLRNKLKKYEQRIVYDSITRELVLVDGALDTVFTQDEIDKLYASTFAFVPSGITVRNYNTIVNSCIESKSPKSDQWWHHTLKGMIFATLGFKEERKLSEILDLENCDYLDDLVLSLEDEAFRSEMCELIYTVLKSEFSDVQHIMDNLEHNIETKEMFEEKGVDYNKWAHYDKDSYIEQNVTITAEAARQKAVKNLCDELTNTTYMSKIPQKELDSLFKRLEQIGVQVDREQKTVKINGRDIVFEDLDSILVVILTEIAENDFWEEEHEDKVIDVAVDLAINHFLQRNDEIVYAKRLKESENVDIKVRKVDMNDIKYALCLGNHSYCCTALGAHTNEWTAPNYILTKCISAIEVIADNKPVGNTMIYLAYVNGELALVLDDIELQIKYQNSDEIRDMIIEYAKKICEEIGKPNIPIYANGGAVHKVDMSPYESAWACISILGKTFPIVYLDYNQDGHEIGYGEIIESDMYKVA